MPASLLDLDEDSLRAVLVRTCAKDHPALRLTCKRLGAILDSSTFVQERCAEEFCEVKARLMTSSELWEENEGTDVPDEMNEGYDTYQAYYLSNPFGMMGDESRLYFQATAMIHVDGRKEAAGTMELAILDLSQVAYGVEGGFHETCDSISGELECLAPLFFTDRASPSRIQSVKQACSSIQRGINETSYFVCISNFWLYDEYRKSTKVGAMALRQIFQSTPLLDCWDLSIYSPSCINHLSSEEKEKEEISEERYRQLTKEDMYPFLRAGFQQVTETIQSSTCYHLFAVPGFLGNTMMTHSEALSARIVERPRPAPELSGEEKELQTLIVVACDIRDAKYTLTRQWEGPALENPWLDHIHLQLEDGRATIEESQAQLDEMRESVQDQAHTGSQMQRMMNAISSLETQLANAVEKLDELQSEFRKVSDEKVAGLRGELSEQKEEVRAALEKLDPDVILRSNAIHVCAGSGMPEFIDIILSFFPTEHKKRKALNTIDQNGMTPLMSAAYPCGSRSQQKEDHYRLCDMLLDLGADKNITHANGMTALGYFRASIRDACDFAPKFGHSPFEIDAIFMDKMERLLRPITGPTAADDMKLLDNHAIARNDNEFVEDDESEFDDDDEVEMDVDDED